MALFGLIQTKREKEIDLMRQKAERIARARQANDILKIRAERLRIKNQIATSKSNSEIKQISRKINKLETIDELKEYIYANFPQNKHWALELLEKPEAQSLISQFIGQGVPISQREKTIHSILENPEMQTKIMEMINHGKK